jgi:UDP-N-acetylmuramoylalanine--D-glutamate ligase
MMMQMRDCRVTVMGLGRHGGGVAAGRWLAKQGAIVTITDQADEEALADSLAELRDVPIASFQLGGHQEADFTDAELIVVNAAVKPGNTFIAAARAAQVPLTSEIELFLERCSGHVIGITGSNGKSTTAAMVAAILSADGRRTWLGGNIGQSLLPELGRIRADDWVVLELSSFQLWWLSDGVRWPEIGVVTNCTPNHLDWHGDFTAYKRAKQRLLSLQSPNAVAVVNSNDPVTCDWQHLCRGRAILVDGHDDVPPLKVPGKHNRRNAACAAAATKAAGSSTEAIRRGLAEFVGLPHRLELVAEVAGRRFYNDSMATTPESVMAAVDTFSEAAWFLVGGYDKGCDFGPLAEKLAREARGVACFGAAREKITALIASHDLPRCDCESFVSMHEALAWCWSNARADESIVLSPACASYDQFRDYRHRGETFAALVRALAS